MIFRPDSDRKESDKNRVGSDRNIQTRQDPIPLFDLGTLGEFPFLLSEDITIALEFSSYSALFQGLGPCIQYVVGMDIRNVIE